MSVQRGNQAERNQAAWGAVQERLIAAVAQKLGSTVSLIRWDEHRRTGAQIPVFAVPADRVADARALGLTVEAA